MGKVHLIFNIFIKSYYIYNVLFAFDGRFANIELLLFYGFIYDHHIRMDCDYFIIGIGFGHWKYSVGY